MVFKVIEKFFFFFRTHSFVNLFYSLDQLPPLGTVSRIEINSQTKKRYGDKYKNGYKKLRTYHGPSYTLMAIILFITRTPKIIMKSARMASILPMGSVLNVPIYFGLMNERTIATKKGSAIRMAAESFPCADNTRIRPKSLNLSRMRWAILSKISARFPPVSL